jgi:hypothetical protein
MTSFRCFRQVAGLTLVLTLGVLPAAGVEHGMIDRGGPVMQGPDVYLLFWLPPGQHFDSGGSTAGDSLYESLINRFFTDVWASKYLSIASEYPGTCGPGVAATKDCLGPLTLHESVVETTPYPRAGTVADPLQDADIQALLTKFMADHNPPITPGLNTMFFVFTGAGIQECQTPNHCTTNEFCAYHSNFNQNPRSKLNPNPVIYAYMPTLGSLPGCSEGIQWSANQLAADREIIAISHELIEAITDPLVGADPAWNEPGTFFEIADICDGQLGEQGVDGTNLHANGHSYVVQEEWSNDLDACVVTRPAITGSTLQITATTAGDDLWGDSSLDAVLRTPELLTISTLNVKLPHQWAWTTAMPRARVFAFAPAAGQVLGNVDLVLSSRINDHWLAQSVEVKLRNADGSVICQGSGSGSVSDGSPLRFSTRSCIPPPAAGSCGDPGQPCCPGKVCAADAGCAAGKCVSCLEASYGQGIMVDKVLHMNPNCAGNDTTIVVGGRCEPGLRRKQCKATVLSQQNGSACTATWQGDHSQDPADSENCTCLIRIQTPNDCSKWVDCGVLVTETQVPLGCN